jgi:hypothetical protein
MASTTEPKVAEPEQSTPNEQQKPEQKHLALGEDDEFEDFPVDGTLPPSPFLSPMATFEALHSPFLALLPRWNYQRTKDETQ